MSLRRTEDPIQFCQTYSRSLQVFQSPKSPDSKKRTFAGEETPGATCRGSLTVEAALVLPLFLFAWLALLSLFPAMQLQITLQNAMEQTAEEAAMLVYSLSGADASAGGGTETSSGVGGESFAGESDTWISALGTDAGAAALFYGRVVSLVGSDFLNDSWILGGSGGLSLLGSSMPGEEPDVKIVVSYVLEIPFFPLLKLPVCQQVCRRAWIGRDPAGDSSGAAADETTVYVAENGTVYHTTKSCSHLQLSVQPVLAGTVGGLRNEDGGKYYPCERCMNGEAQGIVYITGEGDRYHSDRQCAGLKRTVTETTLGETSLPPCSRCGQGG